MLLLPAWMEVEVEVEVDVPEDEETTGVTLDFDAVLYPVVADVGDAAA